MTHSLLLCAHGPQSTQGRAALAGLVNAVRRAALDLDVIDAYVDGQEPLIADAIERTSGPRALVPLMLTYDRAVSTDIVRVSHLDPSVTVTPPLGPDWVLAEVGVQRLIEAGARAGDAIVLAADATTGRRAGTDISKAARLLSAVWGGRVHVGALEDRDDALAEAVDVARAYGGRVVVSSYLLTVGASHEAILGCGADVVTKPLLDDNPPDQRLIRLILTRARHEFSPMGTSTHWIGN